MTDACFYLGITRSALRQRMLVRGIKRVKPNYISEEDFEKIKKPKKVARKPIIIYTPLRITETYHIYESRMNYDPTI